MDNLVYSYKPNTNQLDKVTDAAPDAATGEYDKYNDIKQGQQSGNYHYDEIGNLISDASEGITKIEWTVYGKISTITKTNGTNIAYTYDASGNRISKVVNSRQTWYVRDAAGNVMSIYSKDAAINRGDLSQTEIHLYGSSRLGVYNLENNVEHFAMNSGKVLTFMRGEKFFELSNHLGNVLATMSDKTLQHSSDNVTVDYSIADVVSAQDYYPFGMLMPGRKYSVANTNYRYGFNGKELDKEVAGTTTYDYGFRIYNPGLGRFLSVDPLTKGYPMLTPYQFASNTPIQAIDLDGLEAKVTYQQSYVDKARTKITVKATVEINVQIINLSSMANNNLNLDAVKQNLKSDLETKLSGANSYPQVSPYTFGKSKNGIAPLDGEHPGNYNFDVTYDIVVNANVSVITDKSQINKKNTFVFGIVDKLNDTKEAPNTAGVAYGEAAGKVALGEAKYFDFANTGKNGKNLIFHEILHLLGAVDIYNNPSKKDQVNAMNSLDKNNGSLTREQIVKEIWGRTIGNFWNILIQVQKKGGYKQPEDPSHREDTKEQLEDFVEKQR